ncbi:MAG: DNA sulfur modification protein DndE [Planctomycetota bacterium]
MSDAPSHDDSSAATSAIVETVRVSRPARDQLVTLKRRTGIENWNVLCRWALCVSLAEPSPVRNRRIAADGPIEMSWRTFGGSNAEVYAALVRERCRRDGLASDGPTAAQQFRLHLHRGIAYLAGDVKLRQLADLLNYLQSDDNYAGVSVAS